MITPQTFDAAYAKLTAFGPDLGMSKLARLKKEFPNLQGTDEQEILRQLELISKSVWALAVRGGEAKMKTEDIIAELQSLYPFLRSEGLKQALFLVNYYAWHEGYSK